MKKKFKLLVVLINSFTFIFSALNSNLSKGYTCKYHYFWYRNFLKFINAT